MDRNQSRPSTGLLGFMGRRKRSATTTSPSASSPGAVASDASNVTKEDLAAVLQLPTPSSPQPQQDQPLESAPQGSSDRPRNSETDSVSQLLMKRRSVGPSQATGLQVTSPSLTSSSGRPHTSAGPSNASQPVQKYHNIRFVPHLSAAGRAPSLQFDPLLRQVKIGKHGLTIGRWLDPMSMGIRMDMFDFENANLMGGIRGDDKKNDKVTFKSKVVSRMHAHVWVDETGQFWIKDTKSSSGTFVNHTRLSPPGVESSPHAIKDGDTIQLGVDYQGGREEAYRCVRMKVELGRGRDLQGSANVFNTTALQLIRALKPGSTTASPQDDASNPGIRSPGPSMEIQRPAQGRHAKVGDCCICLVNLTICQALFIAPCSHTFHYRCVRPMVEQHYPGFECPLCRTFANLEAEVEDSGSLLGLTDILNESQPGQAPHKRDTNAATKHVHRHSAKPSVDIKSLPTVLSNPEVAPIPAQEALVPIPSSLSGAILSKTHSFNSPDAASATPVPAPEFSADPWALRPSAGRDLLTINTAVNAVVAGSSGQSSRENLLTAVNPRSGNPFFTDSYTPRSATPVTSPTSNNPFLATSQMHRATSASGSSSLREGASNTMNAASPMNGANSSPNTPVEPLLILGQDTEDLGKDTKDVAKIWPIATGNSTVIGHDDGFELSPRLGVANIRQESALETSRRLRPSASNTTLSRHSPSLSPAGSLRKSPSIIPPPLPAGSSQV